MHSISFQNRGLIDPRAYSLFGASAKEGANPIGYFGTGLKYAIAIFLRHGCLVTLWRGLEPTEFKASAVRMRESEFSVVFAGEQELSYTTELGKGWKPWQAMRELWCNAIDENGVAEEGELEPLPDHTTITITGNAAREAWADRESVFLNGRASWLIQGVEIHDRPSKSLYFRGIRVLDLPEPALFTYNIIGHQLELTEDRTLKHEFYAKYHIGRAHTATDDERLAARFIAAHESTYEGKIDVSSAEPSETFDRVLREQVQYGLSKNHSLRKMLQNRHGTAGVLSECELRPVERKQLERAIAFCQSMHLNTNTFPVIVTDGLEDNVIGLARRDERRIYLNRRVFMMGTKQVAGTLFEELLHLQHGLNDCDRPMQNWLIDKIVSLHEDMQGEPL